MDLVELAAWGEWLGGISGLVAAVGLRADRRGETLTEEHSLKLGPYYVIFWRTYENAFYQYQKGLLEEAEWRGHRHAMRGSLDNSPAAMSTFDRFSRADAQVLSTAFISEVKTILKEIH